MKNLSMAVAEGKTGILFLHQVTPGPLPGAIFIVDPRKERIAIKEAQNLGIPLIGIIDTNCDPDEIDYPIPGNDDAIRAVKLITSVISQAVIEAKQGEMNEVTEEAEVEVVEENTSNSAVDRKSVV